MFEFFRQRLDPDKYAEPMDAVHDVVTRWEKVINDDRSRPFHGVDTPDLADLVSHKNLIITLTLPILLTLFENFFTIFVF
jgi:hypothetical protein